MRTPIPGGLLVAVEGIDGTGKTTVSATLAQWCGERGLSCIYSKEPTSLGFGQILRDSAQTGRLTVEEEVELFRKDRADHVQRSIAPALAADAIVILDRYYWSTAAYQGARGVDFEQIIAENEAIAPQPDLFLLMDLEVKRGIQHVRERGDTPDGFEELTSLERARNIFLTLHQQQKSPSILVSAAQDLRAVCREALEAFKQAAASKISRAAAQAGTVVAPETLELFAPR